MTLYAQRGGFDRILALCQAWHVRPQKIRWPGIPSSTAPTAGTTDPAHPSH